MHITETPGIMLLLYSMQVENYNVWEEHRKFRNTGKPCNIYLQNMSAKSHTVMVDVCTAVVR